jgi:hypothetical protein
MGQALKVRSTDPKADQFEDMSKTENASRDGIYFLTRRDSYFPGMRLFVTLPYYSATDPRNREYVYQVVRVEQLKDGQHGIAVQLLT